MSNQQICHIKHCIRIESTRFYLRETVSTIAQPGTAKNVITVGSAVDPDESGDGWEKGGTQESLTVHS